MGKKNNSENANSSNNSNNIEKFFGELIIQEKNNDIYSIKLLQSTTIIGNNDQKALILIENSGTKKECIIHGAHVKFIVYKAGGKIQKAYLTNLVGSGVIVNGTYSFDILNRELEIPHQSTFKVGSYQFKYSTEKTNLPPLTKHKTIRYNSNLLQNKINNYKNNTESSPKSEKINNDAQNGKKTTNGKKKNKEEEKEKEKEEDEIEEEEEEEEDENTSNVEEDMDEEEIDIGKESQLEEDEDEDEEEDEEVDVVNTSDQENVKNEENEEEEVEEKEESEEEVEEEEEEEEKEEQEEEEEVKSEVEEESEEEEQVIIRKKKKIHRPKEKTSKKRKDLPDGENSTPIKSSKKFKNPTEDSNSMYKIYA